MTDGDMRLLIAGKVQALEARDFYGLLGVESSASSGELKRSYFQLVKLLHPDKLRRRDLGEMSGAAERVFKMLSEAHDLLSNADKRTRYDYERGSVAAKTAPGRAKPATQSIVRPATEKDGEPDVPEGMTHKDLMTRPLESFPAGVRPEIARFLHIRGAQSFAKADFAQAEELFSRCVELAPDQPLYSLKLGWAIFRNMSREYEQRLSMARRHLEHAAARDSYNPEARYCLAQLLKESGEVDAYKAELEAVLRCKPGHLKAQGELEAVKARLNVRHATAGLKKKKKGGLLGKLFGR